MSERLEFDEFYKAEFVKVFRAALVTAGSRPAAEDAAQEAFARALERWRRLRDEPWASGWVVTTAINVARRASRRRILGAVRDVPRQVDPDLTADVWRSIRRLSSKQQTAIVLHHLLDLPVADVARSMGCAEGTVKSHLARGREALRASLEILDA